MKPIALTDISTLVDGQIVGDENIKISGANSLDAAGAKEISFFEGDKNLSRAKSSQAAVLVCKESVEDVSATLVLVKNPRIAFAKILRTFFDPQPDPQGIHPQAWVGANVKIGSSPDIGPFVSIAENCRIGDRVRLSPGVSLEEGCVLGDDVVIHSNVSLRRRSWIGNRVRIQDGAVIGSDGFGYVQNEGRNEKVPQLGIVVLEDDVEIGANTTIDRAAFGETRVGKGTKIDNLVQVAHNVEIGSGTIIISQVGISGSTKIGDYCMIGGQAGIIGHIHIADQVMIGAQSGVTKHISQRSFVSGSPAVSHAKTLRAQVIFPKLPEMREELKRLKKELKELRDN